MLHFVPFRFRVALLTAAFGLLGFVGRAQGPARAWLDVRQSGPGVSPAVAWTAPDGTTYMVGESGGAVVLPGLPPLPPLLPNSGQLVVAKTAPDNTWRWARTASFTGGFATLYGVVGDGRGGLYVAGGFRGTMSFGTPATTFTARRVNDLDGVVAHYDTAGTLLWVRRFSAIPTRGGRLCLAADPMGNAVVAFSMADSATLGAFHLVSTGVSTDAVVARLSPTGQWLSAAQSTGTADEDPTGLAVDAQGNAYVTGALNSMRFGPGPNTDTLARFGGTKLYVVPVVVVHIPIIPHPYAFVAKLDGQGQWIWATQTRGESASATALGVDPTGTAYVVITADPGATFGSAAPLPPGALNGQAVARMSAGGNWQWVRGLSAPPPQFAPLITRVALTAAGHPCLIGTFDHDVYLDTTCILTDPSHPAASTTHYVGAIQLDSAGQLEWALTGRSQSAPPPTAYNPYTLGGGMDAQGLVTVVGTVFDSLALGPVVLTSPVPVGSSAASLFVAHIGPAAPTGLSSVAPALAEPSLYPNPVRRGQPFTLDLPVGWAGAQVEVLNVVGQVVQTSPTTAGLPAGLYTVRICTAERQLARRLVVE